MANPLKTFWNYFGSKRFLPEVMLPGIALFCTWGMLSNLYELSLQKSDFVANGGRVTSIAVKMVQGAKARYYPLFIELDGYPDAFRLKDAFKKDFAELQSEIGIDDTITIFTRTRLQNAFGWGKKTDIYQIDKEGQPIFDLSRVKADEKVQARLCGSFSLILWTWCLIYRRRKRIRLRKPEA